MMVWLVTQSQTSRSVKSNGPSEALLLIKLVDVMEFQWSYSKPYRMMLSKRCTQYVSESGRPNSGDWKRSIITQIPKKSSPKECANHQAIALISHASKVMLKILHPRLQHYVNQELPDAQTGFKTGRGTRDQLPTFTGSQRKLGNSRKPSTCFINDAKAFDCVDDNNFRKLLKRWEYQTTLPVS